MNIHEHQAKQILKKFGAIVPEGVFGFTVEELLKKCKSLKTEKYVLKAQIHAGGRGKAGGVKILDSLKELEVSAKELLGKKLVTHQTGPEGREVKRLYVEVSSNIEKEFYLSCLVDRASSKIAFISSDQGGMDIEEVAEETPELLHKINVDPNVGLMGYQIRDLGLALGLSGASHKSFRKMLQSLYKLFVQEDCAMVEINPLVRTGGDEMVALDAKVSFDENAEFRHKNWSELRDLSEEEDVEIRAKET